MRRTMYQRYINNFRRRFTPYLKPEIGMTCNIYLSKDGGGVLEFVMGQDVKNNDVYKTESNSLGGALSNIEQKSFGGKLDGIIFGGTNTILEKNRIILIKEGNECEWSNKAAMRDIDKLISNSQRDKA